MEKAKKETQTPRELGTKQPAIRIRNWERKKEKTTIVRNKGIQGDTIEVMMQKIREGEGEDSIQDRDLVYNDNEATTVNPVTNIRADKFDLMLDEKIGEYEHKKNKQTPKEEIKEETPKEEGKTE